MVYCGKPSRGCQMCRTRRIKCAKSRRQCPGYKDEFDVVFRNETKATERRAIKANKKAMALARRSDKEPDAFDLHSYLYRSSSSDSQGVPMMPQVPLDQRASCHFVSNFVLLPRQSWSRGYMEFLPALLKSDTSAKHFRYAFEACALASLGNRSGPGQDFEEQAVGLYTKALSTTFAALKDPATATQDSTLAAVLLMGLYENMTARQLGTLAWGSHIEGAIEIAKARGRKQMRTKLGMQLFVAVRAQLIIHALSTGKAPAMGAEWWGEAVNNQHAATCQKLNLRAAEFRAEVNRLLGTLTRSPQNVEIILDLMRQCQLLDQELVNWFQTLPEEFQFETVAWEDNVPNGDYSKAEVFPGRVDAYQDWWIASVWNMARCARVVLSSLIVRCAAWVCSPVDYRTTPEYATAAKTCVDMFTDIIASVPFQLGWFTTRPHLLEKANIASFVCGNEGALKGLLGYWLTWPLTVIHGQDFATDSQRAWARGRLMFIGTQVGIKYAIMLAELKLRIPSMLIRKDGLMNSPYPESHNFVNILSAKTASNKGYKESPVVHKATLRADSGSPSSATGTNARYTPPLAMRTSPPTTI
ncbi:hypothetical protein S40285_07756 [Stachybotrys chlorohalonatus IBT 40285]|uniref:Zn(2)-C6 fungal-type domain-containing protein n=1 Tax=Stachybotrys chlorohalonatus (strain IBT 40285) TaxID=1283841 RepID=A0A084Q948_STAC4|nr:hypothetical protein S40285_07756 [Stachybotrys chlorohalonata IBT 40285]